ncbi:hypothetical protein BJI69_08335 [Luteibacter rhizovicinus DSM 16549]|uniref:Uncharacterized protein n=1 Tax=Luteibacter rhizovicinus DSM 16549 TaxID=1440763 RepID=A0A0G9H2R1_9GAMM|nr:DUF3455 domain-containing protein [Luteibacter rhizovicinus]APG03913.1 hypothetical protein BJI69_08335 [Luteibacter rhizovicinus DSM 16549]KLD63494.1 hypothetical protein Y883_19300 [Luteibacter rhizovicinus DSM 16549]KLD74390.1 hypothetical protein Y886_32945 [Xanthomonas hyacinthi DSM 19077]
MKTSFVLRTILQTCVLAATVVASGASAQSAPAKPPAIEAFGKGVQIYTCKAVAANYAWTLKAPEATLSDVKGNVIGKHFAGPSWQANDGSTVVGEALNASPSPDTGAIPWLVIHAKSTTGSGVLSKVAYVVRTRTEGGVAPATGCDASHADAEVRVPYSAVYLFFPG